MNNDVNNNVNYDNEDFDVIELIREAAKKAAADGPLEYVIKPEKDRQAVALVAYAQKYIAIHGGFIHHEVNTEGAPLEYSFDVNAPYLMTDEVGKQMLRMCDDFCVYSDVFPQDRVRITLTIRDVCDTIKR